MTLPLISPQETNFEKEGSITRNNAPLRALSHKRAMYYPAIACIVIIIFNKFSTYWSYFTNP